MSWLSSEELAVKVRRNGDEKTRRAFGGVYPMDRLPSTIPHYPFFMFVNTQSHNLPGMHWLTVFIDTDKVGEVFDSFGLPLSNTLIRWLNRYTRRWKSYGLTVQHPLSSTCGAFALYYVLNGRNTTFSKTFSINEARVRSFYNALK